MRLYEHKVFLLQVRFLQKVWCFTWWDLKRLWWSWTNWPRVTTWPNPSHITLSNPPTTPISQVTPLSFQFSDSFSNYSLNFNTSIKSFGYKMQMFDENVPCSRAADWRIITGDVPPVSPCRLPLSGARLLEGQTARWRANHHPRLHHDNRDPVQGRFLQSELSLWLWDVQWRLIISVWNSG